MSRLIKMTPEYMDECRADFEKALQLTRCSDGKLSFSKTFADTSRKAVVYFTAIAWVKMALLLNEFDKEVAWHGVAHRVGDGEDESVPERGESEYLITDILVYPQTVTATTVEMDTEKYAGWLMENIEDERFNNIRMQGHSHVRMGTTPSSVDINHQEEILNMLGPDDFYIFMIWNKAFSRSCKIYDMRENTLFEDGDVSVKLLNEMESPEEFIKAAKDMVKDRVYSYQGQMQGSQIAGKPIDKKEGKPRTRIGAGWYGCNTAQPFLFDEDDGVEPYGYSGK